LLVGGDSCLKPPERQISATPVATGTDNGHAEAGFAGAISNQELSAQNSTEMDWMLQNVALKFLSFKAQGFTQVYNVKEGMVGSTAGPGWLKRGLPVERCAQC